MITLNSNTAHIRPNDFSNWEAMGSLKGESAYDIAKKYDSYSGTEAEWAKAMSQRIQVTNPDGSDAKEIANYINNMIRVDGMPAAPNPEQQCIIKIDTENIQTTKVMDEEDYNAINIKFQELESDIINLKRRADMTTAEEMNVIISKLIDNEDFINRVAQAIINLQGGGNQ